MGSPAPSARWSDSEDGDSTSGPPDGPALALEDQVPTEDATLGRREGRETRKPRAPTPQRGARRAAGTDAYGTVMRSQESDDMREASETSGEESEDQEATDAHARTRNGVASGPSKKTPSSNSANKKKRHSRRRTAPPSGRSSA